jgi:Protein of unknown function (DUF4242)
MAAFIDRHRTNTVPADVRHRLYVEARERKTEPYGIRAVAQWIEDETIFCVLEAPDEEAVCRHHAERGLPCDDVHMIGEFQQLSPLSEEDQTMIRAAMARLWHIGGSPAAG